MKMHWPRETPNRFVPSHLVIALGLASINEENGTVSLSFHLKRRNILWPFACFYAQIRQPRQRSATGRQCRRSSLQVQGDPTTTSPIF
jgi:hypothetical protein